MEKENELNRVEEAKQPEAAEKKNRKALKRILACAIVFAAVLLGGGPLGKLLNRLTSGITVIRLDWSALFRLILMVVGLVLAGILCKLFFERWDPKSNHGKTIATLANSAIRYVLALVGILWGLSILGVDVNALLAGAGIVALIIGFGAESLIADVITGIFMLFEHQYEVGDIIVVGDFRGVVSQIGIRQRGCGDRPHAVGSWTADALERGKVMCPDQEVRGRAHRLDPEPLRHVPHVGAFERIGDRPVADLIAIRL